MKNILKAFKVYYMNNDRQKIYVKHDLFYHEAVTFCQKNYKTYNTNLIIE